MLIDIIGSFISLLSTYYFIRLNSKAWPVGIVATCLNGWLYWHKGIYADMVLEILYFLSMGYGWYKWNTSSTKNGTKEQTTLNTLTAFQWLLLLIILYGVFTIISNLLQIYTHSTVPTLDAATTSLSLVAQWLMCHKVIVTWILWFITDALYALMYLNKDLPFHSLLMLIYTGMAVTGYILWAKAHKSRPELPLAKPV